MERKERKPEESSAKKYPGDLWSYNTKTEVKMCFKIKERKEGKKREREWHSTNISKFCFVCHKNIPIFLNTFLREPVSIFYIKLNDVVKLDMTKRKLIRGEETEKKEKKEEKKVSKI